MPGACLSCGLIQDANGVLGVYLCAGCSILSCTTDGCLTVPGAVAVNRGGEVQSSMNNRPIGELGSGEITVPFDVAVANPSGSVPMMCYVRYELSMMVDLPSDYYVWRYANARFMASLDGSNFVDIGQVVPAAKWNHRLWNGMMRADLQAGYTIPYLVPAGSTGWFRFYAAAATFNEYAQPMHWDEVPVATAHQCRIAVLGVPGCPGAGIGG